MSKKPLDTQVGGDHYKGMAIQPMEYSMKNGLDACQHTIIKYVSRFRDKGGVEDLHKAKHCIDMLIEFELDVALKGAGWTPAAVDAAKMPDWDSAEKRMDVIGSNGNDGQHYDNPDWSKAPEGATHWDGETDGYTWLRCEHNWFYYCAEEGWLWLSSGDEIPASYTAGLTGHPLLKYTALAPSWADQLIQPSGTASIYARNGEGRDQLLNITADQLHDIELILHF